MKKCKVCGIAFNPMRPLASVCSPSCASKKVKADKAAEKQKDKERKEKLKTLPELKREAQTVFNRYIRERDRGLPCISCGKPDLGNDSFHGGRDCGHWRGVGSAPQLRYDEQNAHAQCVHCNQYLAGNVVSYRLGLIERIGIEAVERLEQDNKPRKWTREELIFIKQTYSEKLKQLKNEKTNSAENLGKDKPH